MAFKFPFTNYHELNLTWVLDQLKKLFEESAENVSVIQTYDGRLTAVETELPAVSENAAEAARSAAAAATLAQTAKATADTAQENALQAQTLAGTARREAQAAQTAANEATQAAQQAQAVAQNFEGRITQAENDASQALEASRSFENRVQSAITTANNANQTATNAQGIAMRADQNAGAALDKIGDLSQLTTTAKQNLVAAINEAAQSGSGSVTSVNGKTGAVVLDASDIGYNDTTVETALDGKQNAPTAAGTAGQVLGLNNSLQPVWVDQTGGGGDNSNCAPLIINTASGAIASFSDGADNRQIKKIVGTIVPVQSGTGNPSPANVRPISGWTGCNVTRTGKNITSLTKTGILPRYLWGTGWSNLQRFLNTLPPGKYTMSFKYKILTIPTNSDKVAYGPISVIADSTSIIPYSIITDSSPSVGKEYSIRNTFTITENTAGKITGCNLYMDSSVHSGSADARGTYDMLDFMIEKDSSSDYEPYTGNQIPINWQTEAGTVYGGTVTLNEDGSADVVSTMGNIASYAGETLTGAWISSMDVYEEGVTPTTGAQVVYELENPITYHFDNIGQLNTFLGTNNIWIDTGAITECDYPADTKLYIDGKIAELQALVLENNG